MRTPEECLKRAEQAEQRAAAVSDPANRDTLLRTAQQWRELAGQTHLLSEQSLGLAARTATNVEIAAQLSAELKATVEKSKELCQERQQLSASVVMLDKDALCCEL